MTLLRISRYKITVNTNSAKLLYVLVITITEWLQAFYSSG